MPMKSFASEIGKEWLFECQKTIKQIGIKEEDNAFQMSPISTEQFPPSPFEDSNSSSDISPNKFRSE